MRLLTTCGECNACPMSWHQFRLPVCRRRQRLVAALSGPVLTSLNIEVFGPRLHQLPSLLEEIAPRVGGHDLVPLGVS